MKTIFYTVIILLNVLTIKGYAQTPTSIVEICNGVTEDDAPDYTYFKDVNNTFDKFVGTWKWTNGNEILIFKLSKITQKYFPETKMFEDL